MQIEEVLNGATQQKHLLCLIPGLPGNFLVMIWLLNSYAFQKEKVSTVQAPWSYIGYKSINEYESS